MICQMCDVNKEEKEFFLLKDKNFHYCSGLKKNEKHYKICKDCLTANIDFSNTQDIKLLLKEIDYPYFSKQWKNMCDKSKSYKTAFNRYLALMRLCSFYDFYYEGGRDWDGI